MPGAQLVVMKEGHVVYEKAYGRQSYRRDPVTNNDLYDLASITKTAATTLAVMKLFDDGLIKLDKRVRGLPAAVPAQPGGLLFNQAAVGAPDRSATQLTGPTIHGAPVYLRLPQRELSSATRPGEVSRQPRPAMDRRVNLRPAGYTKRPTYQYSDLNFYLLQLVVERVAGQPLDQYVAEHFYRPMGLSHLTYLPTTKFPTGRLVPTVHESWMRGGTLRGFVHDEGAAMLGGVAGHAGFIR